MAFRNYLQNIFAFVLNPFYILVFGNIAYDVFVLVYMHFSFVIFCWWMKKKLNFLSFLQRIYFLVWNFDIAMQKSCLKLIFSLNENPNITHKEGRFFLFSLHCSTKNFSILLSVIMFLGIFIKNIMFVHSCKTVIRKMTPEWHHNNNWSKTE